MPQYTSSQRTTWQVGRGSGLSGDEREALLRAQQRSQHTTWQVSATQSQVLNADNKEAAERALQRLEAAGITSGSEYERLASIAQTGAPPQGNVLTKILGWLDKPGTLVRYAVADIFDIGEAENITGQAYADILLGRKQSLLRRYGAEVVGEDARMSGSQMLTLRGWEPSTGEWGSGWGMVGRALASIGTEVLLDPLSYVTVGAGGATRPVRLAGAASSVRAATDVAEAAARRGAAAITSQLGGRGDDLAREVAERILARQPQTLHELEAAAARNVFGEGVGGAGREALDAVASMLGGRGTAGFGDDLVEASWQAARKAVEDETLDRIAPRILARQFGAPEVESFVRSKYTPAWLKGGLRISPVPVLGQTKGGVAHAFVVPGTRGVGKKITQTIFGKAGTVVGQKPTKLRALIESGLTPWYKGFEEGMKRWDARSYLRGIMGGHVAAHAVLGVEEHLSKIVATQGVGHAIDELRVAYESLAVVGRKAGLSDDELWRVLAQVPVRLLEDMPSDLNAARTAAEALLLREGVENEELRRGIVSFMFNYRRIMDGQWQKLVARGVLKPGQRIENYVPHRLTTEARQLLADLAETGAEIPTDTWQGQLLAELVSSVRLRKMAGGTIGEAQHAGERVIGSTSTVFEGLGSATETHLLNWRQAAATVAAMEPDGGLAMLRRLGIETLDQAGRPTFRFIREMNDGLEGVLRQVVEGTQGLAMPKMKGTEVFHLFDENPLTIATAYLKDVNDAVVERSVIEYLIGTGTLEKVAPTLHAERLAHALAQKTQGQYRAELLAQLARRVTDLEKGAAQFVKQTSRMVKITVDGVSHEVPEVVLTPKVRATVERILRPMAKTSGLEIEVDRLTEKLVARLVKRGVPKATAEAMAHAVEFTGAGGLKELSQAMREAHRTLTRAKFDALLEAALRSGATDEQKAEVLRVLQREAAEAADQVKKAHRMLAGSLRRRVKRTPIDSAFAEDAIRDGLDNVMTAVSTAQRAIGSWRDRAEQALSLTVPPGPEWARVMQGLNGQWQMVAMDALAQFPVAQIGYDNWNIEALDAVIEQLDRALVFARHGRADAPTLRSVVAKKLRALADDFPDQVPTHIRLRNMGTGNPWDVAHVWPRHIIGQREAGRRVPRFGMQEGFNPYTRRMLTENDYGIGVGGVVEEAIVPFDEWAETGGDIYIRFCEQHQDQLQDLGRMPVFRAMTTDRGEQVVVLRVVDVVDSPDAAWALAAERGQSEVWDFMQGLAYKLDDYPTIPFELRASYQTLASGIADEVRGYALARTTLNVLADQLEAGSEYFARGQVNAIGAAIERGGLGSLGLTGAQRAAFEGFALPVLRGRGNLVREAYQEVALRQGLVETAEEALLPAYLEGSGATDQILSMLNMGAPPTVNTFRGALTIEQIEDVRDQIAFVRWYQQSHPMVAVEMSDPSVGAGFMAMERGGAEVALSASEIRMVERGMRSAMTLDPSIELRWGKVERLLSDGTMVRVVEPQGRTWNVVTTGATPAEVGDALRRAGMTGREARRLLLEFQAASRLDAAGPFPDLRIPMNHPDPNLRGMSLLRGCVMDRRGNVVPVFRGDMVNAYEEFTGTVGQHPHWVRGHDDASRMLPGAPSGYTEIDLFADGGLAVDRMASPTPWLRINASEITDFTPAQRFTLADFFQRQGKTEVELESQGFGRGTVTPGGAQLSAPIEGATGRTVFSIDEIAGVAMPERMGELNANVRDALLRVKDDLVDILDGLGAASERLAKARMALATSPDVYDVAMLRAGKRLATEAEDVGSYKFLQNLRRQRRQPKGFHQAGRADLQGAPGTPQWETVWKMSPEEREAYLLAEVAKRRRGEVEGIESLRRGGLLDDEDLKGAYLRDPLDMDEGGVGYILNNADGYDNGGYWVSADGSTASGIFAAESGTGNIAYALMGAGVQRAIVHPDNPVYQTLLEYGWRKVGERGDQAVLGLIPQNPKAVGEEVARRTRAREVLEGLQAAAAKGDWDAIEVALKKHRPLFRDLPEYVDELREHIAAERLLRDPDLSESARELVRARQKMMRSRIGRDQAVQRLHQFGMWVAAELAAMPGATLRRQLESAHALRDIFGRVMDTLASSKPWADAPDMVRKQMDDAIYHARQLGWDEFADMMKGAVKESSTLVAPKGKVLVRAFALSGESVDMVAANPWMGLFLENMVANLQMLNTPIGLRFLAHQARSAENWWKAMATVARPTFHPRNLIGGIWNNQIGGVRLQDYIWVRDKMVRLRHLQRSGKTLEEALATFKEADARVIRDFFDTGVSEASFARADLSTILRPKTAVQRINPLSVHGPLVQGGALAMESIEDFLRMAAFRRWHGEGGAKLAREWTLALHFDYHNLTRFETQVKRFVPFLVWTRRNIPLQMQALVERPDLFARYQHIMHGFDDQSSEDAAYDLPFGSSTGLSIGTSMVFGQGTPFWARAVLSPDLPLNDLAAVENPLSLGSWMNFLSSTLGPHVQLPFTVSRSEEIGGRVNAPAGLNQILLALNKMGLWDDVDADEGVARIPRTMRQLGEALVPVWSEYLRPFDTDPSRRQALGLPSGDLGAPSAAERARAFAIWLARGVGMRTQTPTQAYSQGWKTSEEIREIVDELERRGILPPP